MHSIAIVILCIGSAAVYGIVHDQITARVCIEYFTIGHPPISDTTSPTWLALRWGIIATWWAGFLLGVPLAIAARVGRRPKRSVQSLLRPILTLLLVMGVCALVAGIVGYALARAAPLLCSSNRSPTWCPRIGTPHSWPICGHIPRAISWASWEALCC